MQRMSVDLPEPEGPQMTMRSPLATVRSMPLSAWKLPYHLSTPSILTATSAFPAGVARASCVLVVIAMIRLVALLFLEYRRHRLVEPLLVDLVELAVGFDLVDELIDARQQLLLARLDGNALHLTREL